MTMHCETTGTHAAVDVLSSHRTMDGTVSYVRCHCGSVQVVLADRWSFEPRTLHHRAA